MCWLLVTVAQLSKSSLVPSIIFTVCRGHKTKMSEKNYLLLALFFKYTHSLFFLFKLLSLKSSHISVIADRQSNFYFTKKTDGWKTRTCCHVCIFRRTRITQLCMAEQLSYTFWKWQEHISSAKCGGVCQESQKFSVILGHRARSRPAWAPMRPCHKPQTDRQTEPLDCCFLPCCDRTPEGSDYRKGLFWQWSEGLLPALMGKQR